MPRTALIVEVPEAEPLVKEWRAKHDWSAQHGVPAHITLLFPFVPTERIDDRLHHNLRTLFGAHPTFSFSLSHVARFPEVAWLAPDPAEPFKALIEAISSQYPEHPPYEGIHDEVIPHLDRGRGRHRATGRGRRRAHSGTSDRSRGAKRRPSLGGRERLVEPRRALLARPQFKLGFASGRLTPPQPTGAFHAECYAAALAALRGAFFGSTSRR
jgi:2'-5' RNA ligase